MANDDILTQHHIISWTVTCLNTLILYYRLKSGRKRVTTHVQDLESKFDSWWLRHSLHSLRHCHVTYSILKSEDYPYIPATFSYIPYDMVTLPTYSSFLKSEVYPYRPTRILPACFVLTHMHPMKTSKRSSNIKLLKVKHT